LQLAVNSKSVKIKFGVLSYNNMEDRHSL